MTGLRWLRLNESKLMHLPDELGSLKKLVRFAASVQQAAAFSQRFAESNSDGTNRPTSF